MTDPGPKPASYWRTMAKNRQWIIGKLERRVDALEEELRGLTDTKLAAAEAELALYRARERTSK